MALPPLSAPVRSRDRVGPPRARRTPDRLGAAACPVHSAEDSRSLTRRSTVAEAAPSGRGRVRLPGWASSGAVSSASRYGTCRPLSGSV